MNSQLRALVALEGGVNRAMLEALMMSHPNQLSVLDYVEIADQRATDDARGDVLVVGCSDYRPHVGEYITRVSKLHPGRPVVLICSSAPNGYVGEAFGAGADDIVTLPRDGDVGTVQALSAQLMFALEKAVARKHETPVAAVNAQNLGRILCVLGLKGGSGKTLTAANMAVALADAGQRVAIVDLDLQFGDIGLALGLSPERTLYDLVRAGGSLDAEKIEDFMAVHRSGVRALLAPARPDQAGVVTPEFLSEVYPLLREMHDFVVIDTPPSFTPEVIGAVDVSRDVCLVSALDSLSLKNSRLGLETLQRLDYSGRVRVVLNRADSSVGITSADVVSIIGSTPDVLVPSDRNVTRAMNRGEPIALTSRRSDAARAFHALAALYIADPETSGPDAPPPPTTRRRLFRRGR